MTQQRFNQAEAIHAFDFIQGLGLLGMLLLKTQTSWLGGLPKPQSLYALPFEAPPSDTPIQFFLHLLVNGPFFCLFGVGLGWAFYQRWQLDQQAGLDAGRLAHRRLWILLGLGLLHGLVVGSGDLLHLYALLGFSLGYFVNRSVSSLFRWIAGLSGLVVLIQLIGFLVFPHWPPALAVPKQLEDSLMSRFVNTWQHGSYLDVMRLQPAKVLRLHTRVIEQGLALYGHLEMMLLVGLLVGKLRPVNRLPRLRVRLSLLLLFLFPLAIGLKGVSSLSVVESPLLPARWQLYEPLLVWLCDFLGTPLLTLVYLLEIGLNRIPILQQVGVWIGQLGRMSLTNYLLQSGLCMLLFYDYGLGLSGKMSLSESLGGVIAIYSLQLWFSHWWLSRYPQGPVEQFLNWWTYRKRIVKPSTPVRIE